MKWLRKILGSETCSITVTYGETPREVRGGLPVYEPEIQPQKLARREIFVIKNGERTLLSIDALRSQYYASLLPGELPVIVTSAWEGETFYCGEGTVAGVVTAWEAAPLEQYDEQDARRMIQEFGFPDYTINTKAAYHDLKRLYKRCDTYYRHIEGQNRVFKKMSRAGIKDLVFLLDQSQPDWDSGDGENRFAEEVKRRFPDQVRTESERRLKRLREKRQKIAREERRPLTDTRNGLTRFPHKDLVIEIKDHGPIAIRSIKKELRDGTITPETLVRYRSDSEWIELCDFVSDWMQNKASANQIAYLLSLQTQHGMVADIPLDISRGEVSARIDALVRERGATQKPDALNP